MGFSVTIAAVASSERDAFLGAAGVGVTAEPDADGRGLISAADAENHFLIWRNLRVASLFSEPDWIALSKSAPVTVLDVVDTAGAQKLAYYEGEEARWTIEGSEQHENFLDVAGAPPHDIDEVRHRIHSALFERHPEYRDDDPEELVAYNTEIPGRIFEDLTGLYYEDGPPEGLHALSGDLPLVKLNWKGKRKKPSSKPWWKVW